MASDAQTVYENIATALRRCRSAMSPTAADEGVRLRADGDLDDLLEEVRAIRQAVEKRSETRPPLPILEPAQWPALGLPTLTL